MIDIDQHEFLRPRPQDLGVQDLAGARAALYGGSMRMDCRTGAAQAEGNVHDMLSYEKKPW